MTNKQFRPTDKMINLLRVMLDIDVEPTITAFCKAADINRSTYYAWFDDPDFVGWFNREWEMAMARQVSWLDRVGLQKSVKDFRYWEALQMKYGKFSRRETNTNVNIDANKILEEFTDYDPTRAIPDKEQRREEDKILTE